MKTLFFAAALVLGTAAIAQDTMQPAPQPMPQPGAQPMPMPQPSAQPMPQPSGETVSDPSMSTGERGVTQQGTDPNGQPFVPPGANQGAGVYPSAAAAPGMAPGMGSYPPCTRQVTDRCVQTYERGVRRARARARR